MIPEESTVIRTAVDMYCAIKVGTLDPLDIVRVNFKDGTFKFGEVKMLELTANSFLFEYGTPITARGLRIPMINPEGECTVNFDEVEVVIVSRERDIIEHFHLDGGSTRILREARV